MSSTVLNCQSCFMPLVKPEDFGTETGGGKSTDYCCHCYADGKFSDESTLAEAVEANIPWWRDGCANDDEARARIMEVFPKLKRWAVQ